MVDPTKTYEGKPCPYGGHTLRWRSNGHCVACDRERIKEYRQRPEWKQRNRERAYADYHALDHVGYYERQMRNRRNSALKRMEARHHGSI